MNKSICILFIILFFISPGISFAGDEPTSASKIARKVFEEIRRGSINGELGIYYEHIDYKEDSFVEEDEIVELNDSDLIVPFFQIEYLTAEYSGFSIGAGLTGYTHINGDSKQEDSVGDEDDVVVHKLYLGYEISRTSLKIGRMAFQESLLLSDYYEALGLVSEEIENLFLFLAVVDKVADSDIDKFIDFQNINRGDDSIDDYLLAVETTWNAVPDAITPTLYYYHQGSLYDLYGTHVELFHESEEVGIGLNMDAYATNEDSENGLRDRDDQVKDSDIYHISPFLEVNDFTLAAGYIKADHDVGAREGGLIDDYFNPFNEGDKVYEPDGETWYGVLSYESDSFYAQLIFGKTDYLDGEESLTEKEFDINAGVKFLENFRIDIEFGIIDSESLEGDYKILEMLLTYEF